MHWENLLGGIGYKKEKLCASLYNKLLRPSATSSINEAAEKVGIVINNYPLRLPPYTGGELITKRFPRLCKEGTGVVVQIMGLFQYTLFIE